MVTYLWENLFRKEEKEKDIAHILSENFLFETLSKKEIKFVKDIVHVRHYRPGEIIFRQGEVGVGMYIIMSGSVEIYAGDPDKQGEVKAQPVTRLQPGDFFGEISLVEENGRRTASATAHGETSLIGFFQPDLNEVIDRTPSTGVKILSRLGQVLGKRLKETADKVSELKTSLQKLQQK